MFASLRSLVNLSSKSNRHFQIHELASWGCWSVLRLGLDLFYACAYRAGLRSDWRQVTLAQVWHVTRFGKVSVELHLVHPWLLLSQVGCMHSATSAFKLALTVFCWSIFVIWSFGELVIYDIFDLISRLKGAGWSIGVRWKLIKLVTSHPAGLASGWHLSGWSSWSHWLFNLSK